MKFSLFGFCIVDKEHIKTYEYRIKTLEEQVEILRMKLRSYEEDPTRLLRGQMYSKEIVDEIRELLPRLEKPE